MDGVNPNQDKYIIGLENMIGLSCSYSFQDEFHSIFCVWIAPKDNVIFLTQKIIAHDTCMKHFTSHLCHKPQLFVWGKPHPLVVIFYAKEYGHKMQVFTITNTWPPLYGIP